jgi:hypothetical protein
MPAAGAAQPFPFDLTLRGSVVEQQISEVRIHRRGQEPRDPEHHRQGFMADGNGLRARGGRVANLRGGEVEVSRQPVDRLRPAPDQDRKYDHRADPADEIPQQLVSFGSRNP